MLEKTPAWKGNENRISWGSLLIFDLFLFALLILATRLATILHELMGHTLMVLSCGGDVNGIHVSPLGGGHVYYHLQAEPGTAIRFLVAFAGIIINALSGLFCFKFIHLLHKRHEWALFFILFGMVSLLGATAYSALGFYYQEGDPVAWLKGLSPHIEWLCLPFLFVIPFVSFMAIKSFAILSEHWFPAGTFSGRICVMVLTLGVTGAAYSGLYELTDQRSTAVDAPASSRMKEIERIKILKREALYRELRESRPQLSDDEIWRLVDRTPMVVHPDEVPEKFPLKPVIAALCAAGSFFALLKVKGGVKGPAGRIYPRPLILSVSMAAVALITLIWTGGWIYRN